MTVTPSLIDIITAQVESSQSRLHTCMPGEVVRVQTGEHKRQFVDVQPTLQRQVFDEDTNSLVHEALPVVPMVPVGYMQGGGFFVSVPLTVGDFVVVVFAERSLDHWLEVARKGRAAAVVPGDVGMHCLEGAIALPCGPAPRHELLEGVDGQDLVVGGPAGILLRAKPSGDLVLAEGGVPVALADSSGTEFERIKNDIEVLKAAVEAGFTACQPKPATPPVDPLVAFQTAAALVPSNPASVAASKVKAR